MAFWRRASARKRGFNIEPGWVWSWAASAGFTEARSWPVWASRTRAVAGVPWREDWRVVWIWVASRRARMGVRGKVGTV